MLPADSANSEPDGALTLGNALNLGKPITIQVPLPQKDRLRSIAQSLCFSGRTGAFVPFRRMRGTEGWGFPSQSGSIIVAKPSVPSARPAALLFVTLAQR